MVTPYLGEVRMFAGNFAPLDWHYCDGTLLSISEYQALYTLIGTTYGGNGTSNFALPDLRARVPVSQGQGNSLSNYTLGESYGVENVTLTVPTMAAHNHPFNATSAAAANLGPNGGTTVATAPSGTYLYAQASGATIEQLAPTAISFSGGSLSHTNIMPVLAINYIIALFGVYPSFN